MLINSVYFSYFPFIGSKNQDGGNASGDVHGSPNGFNDQPDHNELQAIQNHNLLIALGGVAARQSGAPHFAMPVCITHNYLRLSHPLSTMANSIPFFPIFSHSSNRTFYEHNSLVTRMQIKSAMIIVIHQLRVVVYRMMTMIWMMMTTKMMPTQQICH